MNFPPAIDANCITYPLHIATIASGKMQAHVKVESRLSKPDILPTLESHASHQAEHV